MYVKFLARKPRGQAAPSEFRNEKRQRLTVSRLFHQTFLAQNPYDQCNLDIQYSVTKASIERLTVLLLFYKHFFARNPCTYEQADIKD